MTQLSKPLWDILRCPTCAASLAPAERGAVCTGCQASYGSGVAALDLRLQRPKHVSADFVLESPLVPQGFEFRELAHRVPSEVDFSGVRVPYHLTPELLSYFPRGAAGSMMLDLGCGAGIHREICEHAGFEYVGLDYGEPGAMLFGDGHALPFADASFDAIISIAVLEHIRYPFIMAREAARVLKPGGVFLGTVAFLEPFHQNSFYHHTHLGTCNTLVYAGFELERIAPSREWDVLAAQSRMGLFPKMPRPLSAVIIGPLRALHRLWWWLGSFVNPKANETARVRDHTGAFAFVARKPRRA